MKKALYSIIILIALLSSCKCDTPDVRNSQEYILLNNSKKKIEKDLIVSYEIIKRNERELIQINKELDNLLLIVDRMSKN